MPRKRSAIVSRGAHLSHQRRRGVLLCASIAKEYKQFARGSKLKDLLAQPNKDVALLLNLGPKTETHRTRLLQSSTCTARAQTVLYAVETNDSSHEATG